uniref:Uncharacterized protein n=1 Tax=viral metagenome TaxID=1070528 RepID=A0A6C0FA47_9ZZZZ|tara:strand:- start:3273 stop:5159 length:1887 start_codon:yes stop_codon:yes gene_type:complete
MSDKKYKKEEKLTDEKKREIRFKAEVEAKKYELIKKRKEDVIKQKKTREGEADKQRKKNKNIYNVKILYKIPKFADENKYEYSGEKTKNKYLQIFVNDKIQYFNEKHPNHLKKGIVRKWEATSEPNVKFEIIFNDPPFIYEKDKNGKSYKTKKKIKIMENVPFKKLKLLEDLKGFNIEIKKTNVLKDKFNLRETLEGEIKNKKNFIVKFYEIIIFLKNIELKSNPKNSLENNDKKFSNKELNENYKIHEENKKVVEEKLKELRDSNINLFYQIRKIKRPTAKEDFLNELLIKEIIYFNVLFNRYKKDFIETLQNQNNSRNKEIKEKAFELFNKILKSFGKIPGSKSKDNLNKKDFFINNDIDYYKFIMGVMKKKNEINKIKFISYEKQFENEIKELVKKKFIKNSQFYPKEVKIKYTNQTTIDKKEFYNNPNKLVEPTDDKVFTIRKYNFEKLTQPNDYYIEKDEKTQKEIKIKKEKIFIIERVAGDEPGIIKIKLNIDLDIKDLLTTNELMNESKGDGALRMIGDFFGNIGNNLNCDVSKKNFNENLNKIAKTFEENIVPPELPNDESEEPEEPEKIKRITSIQKISPEISIISSSFENMKKQKAVNRTLKKNIKSSRNRTMKHTSR